MELDFQGNCCQHIKKTLNLALQSLHTSSGLISKWHWDIPIFAAVMLYDGLLEDQEL